MWESLGAAQWYVYKKVLQTEATDKRAKASMETAL